MKNHIRLRGATNSLNGKTWESEDLLRVGRAPSLEIILDDHSVSRKHAEVALTSSGWIVRDLSSTNGTLVNGEDIGNAERELETGDLLQFGEATIAVDRIIRPSDSVDKRMPEISVRATARIDEADVSRLVASLDSSDDKYISALLKAGRNMPSSRSLEDYFQLVLWETAELFEAGRCSLIIAAGGTNVPVVRAEVSAGIVSSDSDLASHPVVESAFRDQASILAGGESGQPSIIGAIVRSGKFRQFGLLYLERSHQQPAFTEKQLSIADAMALAIAPSLHGTMQMHREREADCANVITALTKIARWRSGYSNQRIQRVAEVSLIIANELGLSESDRQALQTGVPLYDFGMGWVSEKVLAKPHELNSSDKELVKAHVRKGTDVLESIPFLKSALPIIRSHHEWWDGSGYPDGLRGERIPITARIVAVADSINAMMEDRPHRKKMTLATAITEIGRKTGKQFDPQCVRALLRNQEQLELIYNLSSTLEFTVMPEELVDLVGAEDSRESDNVSV